MTLHPEAGFLLSAMEHAWGKEKAFKYLNQLAKQNLAYVRGQPVTRHPSNSEVIREVLVV